MNAFVSDDLLPQGASEPDLRSCFCYDLQQPECVSHARDATILGGCAYSFPWQNGRSSVTSYYDLLVLDLGHLLAGVSYSTRHRTLSLGIYATVPAGCFSSG